MNVEIPIVAGFSSKNIPMIDLDNTSLEEVVVKSRIVAQRFKLGGFLVLRSSKDNYHVVFARKLPPRKALRAVAFFALLQNRKETYVWFTLQVIKGSFTLRVSKKVSGDQVKPEPKPVYFEGILGEGIREYLAAYKEINDMLGRLEKEEPAQNA